MNSAPIILIAPALAVVMSAAIGGCTRGEKSPDATKVGDAGTRTDATLDADRSAQVAEGFVIDIDGGLDEARHCERNRDCTVVQTQCACIAVEIDDVAAINRRFVDRATLTCNQRCATPSAPQFIARCETGLCNVFDIRKHVVSECLVASDCALRVRECCECGGNTNVDAVIALPTENFAEYQALVCDDAMPACDDCVASYPPTEGFGLIAQLSCVSGHCSANAVRVEPQ